MNYERFEDLKDAYVLDALPEEERRSFEEYLAAHPERQAEIDELGAVAGLLAFAPKSRSRRRSCAIGSWRWSRPRRRPAASGEGPFSPGSRVT